MTRKEGQYNCYLVIFTNLGIYLVDDIKNCKPCKKGCVPEQFCQREPNTIFLFIYEDIMSIITHDQNQQKLTLRIHNHYFKKNYQITMVIPNSEEYKRILYKILSEVVDELKFNVRAKEEESIKGLKDKSMAALIFPS